jgi:cytoskeletal protein CcmA (bactofilin family)
MPPSPPGGAVPPTPAELSGAGAVGPKPSPSLLSSDITVKGNVSTSGDMQIEGTIEGDVRAHLLTVGESATIRGEVIADDVVVNGRVIGRLRGLKVRLTSTARVEGDIVHKSIAIESGAHFEGSVQRREDPLGDAPPRGEAPLALEAPNPGDAER